MFFAQFKPRNLSAFALALFTAGPAFAHGEEALASGFAQVVAVAGTLLALRLLPKARRHWMPGL